MKCQNIKIVSAFFLGILLFAVGYFIVSTFIIVERPEPSGIIYDWERICFWPDAGGIYATVSPKGCFSTACATPKLQTGTAVVDKREYKIELETRFVIANASRFPLPCTEDCAGGGSVQFIFDDLIPSIYEVWFRDELVGELMIYSGLPTPRQCFENIAD
jgi:hypothetical protein